MATTEEGVAARSTQMFYINEDDTDQQIEDLLREAEQRMRSAATTSNTHSNHQRSPEAVGENIFGEDELKSPHFK